MHYKWMRDGRGKSNHFKIHFLSKKTFSTYSRFIFIFSLIPQRDFFILASLYEQTQTVMFGDNKVQQQKLGDTKGHLTKAAVIYGHNVSCKIS